MGVSERFACRVTGQNRTTQRHEPASTTVADPDAGLRQWLRDYAKDHPRRGFRPAYHDARGEGWNVNHKKIQRLWREEGLRVPQRRRKRLGTSTAADRPKADAPNRVWAVDFPFDATTDGRPIKIVSIIDEHTRECLGGRVERSVTGEDLIDELDRLAGQRGYPRHCCIDRSGGTGHPSADSSRSEALREVVECKSDAVVDRHVGG
jgi:putative transposase